MAFTFSTLSINPRSVSELVCFTSTSSAKLFYTDYSHSEDNHSQKPSQNALSTQRDRLRAAWDAASPDVQDVFLREAIAGL
jgi:hypothetical protein